MTHEWFIQILPPSNNSTRPSKIPFLNADGAPGVTDFGGKEVRKKFSSGHGPRTEGVRPQAALEICISREESEDGASESKLMLGVDICVTGGTCQWLTRTENLSRAFCAVGRAHHVQVEKLSMNVITGSTALICRPTNSVALLSIRRIPWSLR
jgi:hypothetical protein